MIGGGKKGEAGKGMMGVDSESGKLRGKREHGRLPCRSTSRFCSSLEGRVRPRHRFGNIVYRLSTSPTHCSGISTIIHPPPIRSWLRGRLLSAGWTDGLPRRPGRTSQRSSGWRCKVYSMGIVYTIAGDLEENRPSAQSSVSGAPNLTRRPFVTSPDPSARPRQRK